MTSALLSNQETSPPVRPRIRILADDVVNQIAAGEVVERPASVVKELVENAIDSGALDITVSVSNGGKSEIEVVDDGCGMSRSEALLAIERFGTSKIQSAHDLLSIATLGFRGEALPSIASVSRFSLASRPQDNTSGVGVSLTIEGGKLRDVVDAALPFGTRITVRNLFFNVPARRGFLRSETTELGNVRAQMSDFAAANPRVRFRLMADGREVFHVAPAADLFERLEQLKLVSSDTVFVRGTTTGGPIQVRGVIAKPAFSVSSSNRLRLLLNGRAVRDRLLLKAVRDGYGNFLKGGRYPSGLLSIELPSEVVDVNVHPQKSEVRFRSPDVVFVAVKRCVEMALMDVAPLSHFLGASSSEDAPPYPPQQPVPTPRPLFSQNVDAHSYWNTPRQVNQAPVQFNAHESLKESEILSEKRTEEVSGATGTSERMRFLGQVFELYLLFADQERLVIVDMHAAHERVTFYRLKRAWREGKPISQRLAFPEAVPLPSASAEAIRNFLPMLESLGFDVELLGEEQLVVRAIPSTLSRSTSHDSVVALVRDLVSFSEGEDLQRAVDQRIDAVLARLACHGSIRRGRPLGREEAYALMDELEQSEASGFCPHGRPVARTLKMTELENLFDR